MKPSDPIELLAGADPASATALQAEMTLEQHYAALERAIALGGRRARVSITRPARRRTILRPVLITLFVMAVLVGAAAVSPVRAALDDLRDTLTGYLSDDNPPGRPLEPSDDPPAWLRTGHQTGQRVIASAEGHSLYLSHDADAGSDAIYTFSMDKSVGIGDTAAGWQGELDGNAIYILGRTGGARSTQRLPLFGITAGDVATVELRYYGGGKETASATTGGFVLMMDPYGNPAELVALDAAGKVLQTTNAVKYGNDAPQGHKREAHETSRRDRPRRVVVPENSVYLD